MRRNTPECRTEASALGPSAQPRDHGLRLVEAKKLTVREAAKAAGMSESAMRQAIQADEIPVLKFGVKMLVLEVDLEGFLRRHYVYEGAGSGNSRPCHEIDLPEWVDESPFLQPKRKAS